MKKHIYNGRSSMKKFVICIITILILGAMVLGGYVVLRPNNPEVSGYRIKNEVKKEVVWCVKVTGMKNILIQAKLNRTIQKEWMLWLKSYLEEYPSGYDEVWNAYIVSDRFVCVTNRLDCYNFAMGDEYYCAVYDLKTGDKVYLDDLFELSDGFIQALQQYGKTWQCDLGEIMVRISGFENDSEEEIRSYLEKTVMTQFDYNNMIEGTDRKSYYKPDFIISGDALYFDVKIPLDKLEEFLKVPKWWKSKPGLDNADLEMANSEIKRYLDMTNREIADLSGKEIDNYADTFVFKTKVLLPCIRPSDLPFYFVCGDWLYDEQPRYLAFYEEAEEEYIEMLGINKNMGFDDIVAAIGIEPVLREATEGVDDYDRERHKIELEKDGLRYIFCSDHADGYDFSMFIERIAQK